MPQRAEEHAAAAAARGGRADERLDRRDAERIVRDMDLFDGECREGGGQLLQLVARAVDDAQPAHLAEEDARAAAAA